MDSLRRQIALLRSSYKKKVYSNRVLAINVRQLRRFKIGKRLSVVRAIRHQERLRDEIRGNLQNTLEDETESIVVKEKIVTQIECEMPTHEIVTTAKRSKPYWMSSSLFKQCSIIGWPADVKKSVSTRCKGCNEQFECRFDGKNVWSPLEFYVHCIDDCSWYKRLNLISPCRKCDQIFIDPSRLNIHLGQSHRLNNKRNWMSKSILKRSMYRGCNSTVRCEGCGRQFSAVRNINSAIVPRIDFYIHCIEKCKKYRNLGKIRTCTLCPLKFINNQALSTHERKCGRTY